MRVFVAAKVSPAVHLYVHEKVNLVMAKHQQAEQASERRSKSSDRRASEDRRKEQAAVAVERRQGERRVKVPRRRQIDPTTCEREYSNEEIEFMHAMDAYKRASGRMFPTCSEILEVIRNLGYVRMPPGEVVAPPATTLPQISQAPVTPEACPIQLVQ